MVDKHEIRNDGCAAISIRFPMVSASMVRLQEIFFLFILTFFKKNVKLEWTMRLICYKCVETG